MQIIPQVILISISVTSTPFLGNPITADTLNRVFGIDPGVLNCLHMLWKLHILLKSFNSALISEIKLRIRNSLLIADEVCFK